MEDNYYRERNIGNKLPIILIIAIATLLIAVVAFFIIKGSKNEGKVEPETKFDVESDFLAIGKEYFEDNSSQLPIEVGECNSVTLETLLSKGLIKNTSNYNECNKYNTNLKVCKLQSKKYQYVPILVCDSVNSEQQFSEWKVGNESNLIADSSDVQFSFLGYKKIEKKPSKSYEKWEDEITDKNYKEINKTTYYRYRDKEWLWQETSTEYFTKNDVGVSNLAYYATSPSSEYTSSDSETTAYKWYTQQNVATEPEKIYVCKSSTGSATAYKKTPCSEAIDGKTETVREFFTCGVQAEKENGAKYYLEIPEGSVCDCSSEKYGINCSVKRTYYPSGESDANRESVYYESAPIRGAIQDVSTKLTVSRYYKEVITTTSKYYTNSPSATAVKVGEGRWGSWSQYSTTKPKTYDTRQIETRNKIKYELEDTNKNEWEKISNDYISLEAFISKLKALDYSVSSLTEINNNEELKYDIQLKYRNKNN